ncbi:MAG TPA: hypothetical protein EYH05_04075 [Anaerolineae bacterium]|nr:hypothetical protein [Anaerolineae bacterium]
MEIITPYLPFIAYTLGVVARIILPYLQDRLAAEGPVSFDWRYIVGLLIAAAIGIIPLFASQEYINQITAMTGIAAFVFGWGVSDMGRLAQKQLELRFLLDIMSDNEYVD